ncbi:hypothetical protein PXK58_00770 [Phaeobacter gallaeciensis]|uniref:hypothetical protein n=1 Tax=Phaeobacter gallaeciensis TaxID=60890 RepID=UPI00237FE79E|nr:hypothetical protein [Phaeobacter gallaeciensis]MDE4272983.1 hypothetical protein [Phaeobacter gallaeciensis]MDE4298065.1 hypothetical protein [Phaeobacter gallaeciensis]MDE5183253.1 hypothetical protein [Phaeobacter gallaeciensis]
MGQEQRTLFCNLPAPQQAGMLCNDPQFRRFAAVRSGFPDTELNTAAAAEYLRQCCRIDSRRDLATNPTARDRFNILRTEFDGWAGRIPTPR